MLLLIVFMFSISATADVITRIDLEFKDYTAMNYKKTFFEKFKSIAYENKSSPGIMKIERKEFKIKLKTNGELPKHWDSNTKSYNVTIIGSLYKKMNRFNLVRLADKSYFAEGFALQLAKESGLLVPYYEYINLCISKDCELYLMKEDLAKNFIESRYLRGSSFFKTDFGFKKFVNKHPIVYKNSYQSSFSSKNPALYNHLFYKTIGSENNNFMFRHLLKNGKKLHKSKYKVWFYIQKFFGSFHASEMDNKVWFFNIQTFKFEPILHDVLLSNYKYSILESVNYLRNYDYLLRNLDISSQEIPKQIFASMKALDPYEWKGKHKKYLSIEQISQVDELIHVWKNNLEKIGKELKGKNSQ